MSEPGLIETPPLSRLFRMAVLGAVESAVRIHVDRGDNLDARDGNGLTPLMLSAARNHAGICKLLLDAGADRSLLSPLGETALSIAMAAGAQQAVSVLVLINSTAPVPADPVDDAPPTEPSLALPALSTVSASSPTAENGSRASCKLIIGSAKKVEQAEELCEFDLDGWEAENENPPPEADQSVIAAVRAVHKTLIEYDPFDSSADWADFEVYLPNVSVPLLRGDALTSDSKLRMLLLHAIRYGSVSRPQIEALSVNAHGASNSEMEAIVSMAVNGVGAEITDQAEEFDLPDQPDEFDEVESPSEGEALDEAMFFIAENASKRTAPLRYYQKDLQLLKLLTSQQEVSLARQVENDLQETVDALAEWPHGLALVLAVGRQVETGRRMSSSYTRGAIENEADLPATPEDGEVEPVQSEDENDVNGQASVSEKATADQSEHPSVLLRRSLTQLELQLASETSACPAMAPVRETLSSLRLNHQFLFELAEAGLTDKSEHAVRYSAALLNYLRSWEQMVLANVKLAFSLAQKYLYSGEPLDDLTQEGNLGLFKAIERFDWRLGNKFSTYATWWIRQSVGRHVADKCRTIRLPVHVHTDLQRMLWETQALESESGSAPSLEAIADRTNMRPHKVAALQRLEAAPISIDEVSHVELMRSNSAPAISLPDPEEQVAESQLRQVVDRVLSTLEPREEQIIRLRFGIGVEDALTLEQVGSQFGVTRERTRQIEAKALKKLRQPSRIHALSLAYRGTQAIVEASRAPACTQSETTPLDGDTSSGEPSTANESVSPDPDDAGAGLRPPPLCELTAEADPEPDESAHLVPPTASTP